jgi:hypothetical protein
VNNNGVDTPGRLVLQSNSNREVLNHEFCNDADWPAWFMAALAWKETNANWRVDQEKVKT